MSQPCSYDWCIATICAGYFLGGVGLEKSSRLVDMSELSPTSCSKRLQEIRKKKGGGGRIIAWRMRSQRVHCNHKLAFKNCWLKRQRLRKNCQTISKSPCPFLEQFDNILGGKETRDRNWRRIYSVRLWELRDAKEWSIWDEPAGGRGTHLVSFSMLQY